MNHNRLLTALIKAGAEITEENREPANDRFIARRGSAVVIWYKQGDLAQSVHTPSLQTDVMSDCFCDYFHRTIKSAAFEISSARDAEFAAPATNWKSEVCVEGSWSSNACVFATELEAAEAGKELLSRWWVPSAHRPVKTSDPVNYRMLNGRPERIITEEESK